MERPEGWTKSHLPMRRTFGLAMMMPMTTGEKADSVCSQSTSICIHIPALVLKRPKSSVSDASENAKQPRQSSAPVMPPDQRRRRHPADATFFPPDRIPPSHFPSNLARSVGWLTRRRSWADGPNAGVQIYG
jgi:hypothetical protein